MEELTKQIVDYSYDISFEDLPADVIDRTKQLILDAIGCGFGGISSEPARIACRVAAHVRSDMGATVLGTGQQTSPDLAAFASGVMIRYLDYNDTHTLCHPSDLLAPILACAECAGRDGKDILLGMVIGYEVMTRLSESFARARSSEKKSVAWDQANYAIVAASVVAARLLGLSRDQAGHAISLATVSHLTLGNVRKEGQLSQWKGCAVANASRNAVFCAMLAKDGLTGPSPVFDGPAGLFQISNYKFDFVADPRVPFQLMRTQVKSVPAGLYGQGPAQAASELAPLIKVDDIREVRVTINRDGLDFMAVDKTRWAPETRETADHSLPFVVAACLMYGRLGPEHYDNSCFTDEAVRSLMAKIRFSADEQYVKDTLRVHTIVEVETQDGKIYKADVPIPLGHPDNPMSWENIETKFNALAGKWLPEGQPRRLIDAVRTIELLSRAEDLLKLTLRPSP